MGSGASIECFKASDVMDIASLFMQRQSNAENIKMICSILDLAHGQGINLQPIQDRINGLIEKKSSWPWTWSEKALVALRGDFTKVDGFSHMELCIYKEKSDSTLPFLDGRFNEELVALFSAFYREQDENVHPLEIIEITAIHNPVVEEAMTSSALKIREQVNLGGAYEAHWKKTNSPEAIWNKEQTLDVMGLADPLNCIIGFAGQSDPRICRNICSNGFADLAKTDPGYFGRGVYLTTHSEYASLYAASTWSGANVDIKGSINDVEPGSEFTILAAYATPGVCYPITRDTDYSTNFCWCDLKGQGMKFGYHSHAVLVNRLRVLRALNYQAMQPISSGISDPSRAYGELVLQHTAQAFPRYVIRCRRRDDSNLAVSPGKERVQRTRMVRPSEPEVFAQGTITRDIQVLVEFFDACEGAHWKVNTNWCKDLNISTWMGPHYPVGIDNSSDRVTRLRLAGNNISGVLPSSLSELDHLIVLDISDNQLQGQIPAGIGDLRCLEELYLDHNRFFGKLSVSLVFRKTKLARRCRLGKQSHETETLSLPSQWSIADLKRCGEVDSSLQEIRHVLLRECSLGGPIPISMCEVLSRCGDTVSEGDEVFDLFSAIVDIDLACNSLTGAIPSQINQIKSLQRLDLSQNKLSGFIPNLAALTGLRDLVLSNNLLNCALPTFITTISTLRNLDLSSNQLTGDIPDDYFVNMAELLRFECGNNCLTGNLPSSASCLQNLILFSIERNEMEGCIPSCYSNMVSLRGFNASHNKLTGPIPAELAALPTLQRLEVACNEMSGPLPSFGTSEGGPENKKLRIINLSYNQFTGKIPIEWRHLVSLDTVNLENNDSLILNDIKQIFSARVELVV